MKNFFKEKMNKKNPFIDETDNKGEAIMDTTNEIKDKDIENKTEEPLNNEEQLNSEEEKKDNVSEENQEDNELDNLKIEFENLNNQYLRLAADFDNYRKRQVQERESLLKYGAQECMKKVIEVVDNFDRASEAVEKIDNVEKMKETFYILHKQLLDSLTKLGLEQIKCVGEKFDPNLHEAVMQTQTEEYPEETVIKELQKGYKLGDKVLRPAMVDVAVK